MEDAGYTKVWFWAHLKYTVFLFLRLEVSQYVYIYIHIYIYHYIHIISSWHYRQKLGGTCSRDFVDVTTFFF